MKIAKRFFEISLAVAEIHFFLATSGILVSSEVFFISHFHLLAITLYLRRFCNEDKSCFIIFGRKEFASEVVIDNMKI